jgi:hypothetical protein
VGWLLSKERNARTFDAVTSTLLQLATRIMDDIVVWELAGFKPFLALLGLVSS